MNFSAEQFAIFAHFKSGAGNLVIEAFAGTGKTTTVKEAFNHAPEARILYAVFNKRNQKEAEEKIQDPRVDVKTLHSLGYSFIKRVWRNAKPDDEVEVDRAVKECPAFSSDKESLAATLKLVGFAKNTCLNPTRSELENICEIQDIGIEGLDIISIALRILERSKQSDAQSRISFNDMVWLPVAMGWVRPMYGLVCIDEAQDMNLPQLMMARGASSGRVIVVGDSRQAIYGFRGAVQDGMQMMKVTLRASSMMLSTTYRCPKLVVKIAAEIVPDYKAADTAPDGLVGNVQDVSSVKIGDAILSRLNAPLMPLALSILRKNIPARIEGRDIGRQLIGMVRTMKAKSVPHFIERVESWLSKQIERLERTKNADKKIEQTRDIADTLKALAQDSKSVADIESRITSLFQDSDSSSKPAVVLSTVHKAKGLEWPRVFILTETFRKGKGREEDNIWYVAVTRSMRELYFVGGGKVEGVMQSPENVRLDAKAKQDARGISDDAKAVRSADVMSNDSHATNIPISIRLTDNLIPAGMIEHEVGNVIKLNGKEIICSRVSDSGATFVEISNKGAIHHLSRCCEPSLIIRRDNFIPRKVRSKDDTTKQSGIESETDMSKKKKAATVKGAAKPNGAKPPTKSGRAERVMELVSKTKKTDAEVLEVIQSEFPGGSPKQVMGIIASKRMKLGKAGAAPKKEKKSAPAKKDKSPAKDKKPAKKKAAKKSDEPTAEVPPRPEPEPATE
jgi:hypothetical protein